MLANDGTFVEMMQQPYDKEDVLQQLLEDYPRLLGGDLMGHEVPRVFVMVSREISLVGEERGVGRIDHVFLDQEGVPTLVEVKRSSDARIRREVVGQMLDYAANAVRYWPVEDIRARFEEASAEQGVDAVDRLSPVLGDEGPDAYWARVGANLGSGRLRLVFVADLISAELGRIIEFLNEQMSPAEVLGVEVKQYADAATGVRNLVPRVVGMTAAAETKGGSRGGPTKRWTEPGFFEAFDRRDPQGSAVARRLLEWATPRFAGIRWGYGKVDGTFYPRLFADRPQSLFVVYTSSTIEIRLGNSKNLPPYTSSEDREQLRSGLNEIPGWQISPETLSSFAPISGLQDDKAFTRFTDLMEAAARRIWEAAETT
jgi:hypothetical protein